MKSEYSFTQEADLLRFYRQTAIRRADEPSNSCTIAEEAYLASAPKNLRFELTAKMARIRDELGALSAPGAPDTDQSYSLYEDQLWSRFINMLPDQ